MTTLSEHGKKPVTAEVPGRFIERRKHRRHDLSFQSVTVQQWGGHGERNLPLGQLIDLSSGGMRVRTQRADLRPDQQIRIRLELPTYAGISPFVDTSSSPMKPKTHWVGWVTVNRVQPAANGQYDVAGCLVDMDPIDMGMLGLYLSTQPLTA